jgi:RNA polymerase sigma factor (sigma-70 family)
MQDLSDEALMVAVSARQQQAFRILMGRHMQRAVRVAQRVVRDSAEADDIGQDAFLRVWSHAASFDPDVARFTTWLYRIVLNLAFDRGRRRPLMPRASVMEARDTRVKIGDAVIDTFIEMLEQISPKGRRQLVGGFLR